jgi:hypothetical protein
MFSAKTDTETLDFETLKARAMGRCVKRPVVHGCFMIHERMIFETGTGVQVGYPGMIAIVGKDHAWPVTAEYFHEHYDKIEG